MIEETSKKLKDLKKQMKNVIIGRDNIITGMVLALASNQHILIMGKHGEAKSMLVNELGKATGLNCYSAQIHQETIVKDIVGLLNPIAYNKGEIDIIKTPFWNSEILYMDEILRGRSEFLDFLLEVMIERKTSKTLLGNVPLPVLSVIATTNPLNDNYNTERMDFALKDRFFAIINIDHLIEDDSNVKFIRKVLENNGTEVESVGLTREELIDFSKESKKVKISIETVVDIFTNAQKSGFTFSTRFIKTFKEICQTYALMNGRNEVSNDDFFDIASIMLINRYEKFTTQKIEDCVDESLLKTNYADTIKKIEELNVLKKDNFSTKVFLEKAIEVIEETKQNYNDMPKNMRDKIDKLTNDIEEKVRLDNKTIPPSLMSKLDTERFKHLIADYIKHKTIETRYLDAKTYKENKTLFQMLKHCEIQKDKQRNYIKLKFVPKINEPESFNELESFFDLLATKNLLSVV